MSKIMQSGLISVSFLLSVDEIRGFRAVSVYRMNKIMQNEIIFASFLLSVDAQLIMWYC